MTSTPALPPGWVERIRALAAGEFEPVLPRPAATVLLLRDAPELEVYLLRRRSTMAFAAGMYAFPGGSVDPADFAAADPGRAPGESSAADVSVPWIGPDQQAWASVLGCPPNEAAAVVCAAVRETFEESGVLLAGPDADTLADSGDPRWEERRAALVRHETSLPALLREHGLALRADLLRAWSRWITPPFEERRYDTWFFVAALPPGAVARDVSGEADRVAWRRPLDALADYRAGGIGMLPPTLVVLREIALRESAAAVLAAAASRTLTPLSATVRPGPDGPALSWPLDDPFGAEPFPV